MNLIQSEHAKLWYAGSAQQLEARRLSARRDRRDHVGRRRISIRPSRTCRSTRCWTPSSPRRSRRSGEGARRQEQHRPSPRVTTALTAACNSCHQATDNGFVVIQRPAGPAFPNQNFRPRKWAGTATRAKCGCHDHTDEIKALAPTGKLRGGVVVSPAASVLRHQGRKGDGVTVDLLRAFAGSSKLPLDMQVYTIPARSPTR